MRGNTVPRAAGTLPTDRRRLLESRAVLARAVAFLGQIPVAGVADCVSSVLA